RSFSASQSSAAEHFARIERDLDVFPLLVMFGLEHVVRLAAVERAGGAFASRDGDRAVARARYQLRPWSRGNSAVSAELDPEHDHQLLRISGPSGRSPKLGQALTQRVELALRDLRRLTHRGPERGRRVERVAGGGEPRRIALVEQGFDLPGIEFRRRWRRLLRRGRRFDLRLL